jgi:hypothetical protein
MEPIKFLWVFRLSRKSRQPLFFYNYNYNPRFSNIGGGYDISSSPRIKDISLLEEGTICPQAPGLRTKPFLKRVRYVLKPLD